jgi:hypothetical protein
MFKLAKQREVLWPVTVTVPVDGGVEKVEIQVRYRLLTRSEMLALRDEGEQALEGLVRERVTGWDGVADASGEPLPFSPETLEQALDNLAFFQAVSVGLLFASQGALAKN